MKNVRKAKMAECIAQYRTRDLWSEHVNVNGKKMKLPPHIDNKTQNKDINSVFANKYKLNTNPSYGRILEEMNQSVKHDLESYNGHNYVINVEQVSDAIHMLKKEKPVDSKGLWSNHFIYAPHIFKLHMALLLTSMQCQWIYPRRYVK